MNSSIEFLNSVLNIVEYALKEFCVNEKNQEFKESAARIIINNVHGLPSLFEKVAITNIGSVNIGLQLNEGAKIYKHQNVEIDSILDVISVSKSSSTKIDIKDDLVVIYFYIRNKTVIECDANSFLGALRQSVS